jgi:DNA-binding beta-propeller fold protein YncE
MKSISTAFRRNLCRATVALLGLAASLSNAQAGDTYKWTVQYLVDNSQAVYGQSQKIWPRRNRGLAISPDGKFLYAGYHHGGNGQGEIRKIAVGIADDFTRATVRVLTGPLGKAIATDDKGRVYIANEGEILIYDENLSQLQFSIQAALCEGVATVRDGKDLILFSVDRQTGTVHRWTLEEKAGAIASAAPSAGFGENGEVFVKNAASLRGCEVDPQGRVWVADLDGNRVFRVSKDGKTIDSLEVTQPMDIGFDGDRAFITRGKEHNIAVAEVESLKLLGNLAVPWDELELNPVGNNRLGSLSSIVTVPGKGFFVTNESGQTLNQKSTYGRADANTDIIDGKLYRDATMDDNDPILQALVVPDGK